MLLYFQLTVLRLCQMFKNFLLSHLVLLFLMFQPHYFLFLPPRPLSVKSHSHSISDRDMRNLFLHFVLCLFGHVFMSSQSWEGCIWEHCFFFTENHGKENTALTRLNTSFYVIITSQDHTRKVLLLSFKQFFFFFYFSICFHMALLSDNAYRYSAV